MTKKDDLLERAFVTLKQESTLTEQQKEVMLNCILMNCNEKKDSSFSKLKKILIAYPWRFAFTTSIIQSVVFTIIFGTQYTNLFLVFNGG